MMKCRSVLTIGVVLACACIFSWADAAVHPWAVATPEKISYHYTEKLVDGIDSYWYDLSADGFAARWFPGGEWWLQKGAHAASVSFYQKRDASVRMELFLYPTNRSLPNLTRESLGAYVHSLPVQFPRAGIRLENIEIQAPPLGAMPLFGGSYRLLKYNLLDKQSGEAVSQVCDFLAILDSGQMVILRFTVPHGRMQYFESAFSEELSRFTLR